MAAYVTNQNVHVDINSANSLLQANNCWFPEMVRYFEAHTAAADQCTHLSDEKSTPSTKKSLTRRQ